MITLPDTFTIMLERRAVRIAGLSQERSFLRRHAKSSACLQPMRSPQTRTGSSLLWCGLSTTRATAIRTIARSAAATWLFRADMHNRGSSVHVTPS